MRWQRRVRRNYKRALVLIFCVALVACRSHQGSKTPAIEFTKIPPEAEGGRERVDTISGRVTGARPGQQIVVYARSGPWWVQPWPDQPFIKIQSDLTWTTPTHLGHQYAALLVEPGYHPPATMDAAPTVSGAVVAVAIVKGVGFLPTATKPLRFGGYDWAVRTIRSDRGGMNNPYDPDNAYTDPSGALHLRIKKKNGVWTCAEMKLTRSLGYGTYLLTVRDTAHLEPSAIFSLHTWDDYGDEHYRELDLEIGRWGDPDNKNDAQYGIQPFYVPGNLVQFSQPAGTLTHSIRWESGRATFKTVRGSDNRAGVPVVYEHAFESGVPSVGEARVVLDLYVVASNKSPLQKDTEVVVEKFEYLP